ncbi:SMI1/KNR4 family protein [Nocardia vulneris]|uniref:SMI1/KNR4 family protein n=1 Tax=Nocardia vulneris TaxID=1141657 RepID=UPI000A83A775|nr:SMI1/KNR4 family protein [Nocardia vulneris]
MRALCRDLVESGFAKAGEIVGCTADEVAEVVAMAPGAFPVPDEYLAFLAVLGKSAGTFFVGTDLFYPALLEANEAAVDINSGPGEDLSLSDRFFFGHHKGYKVYFFERNSEAVYTYQEGHPEVQRLAGSLLEFLRQAFEIQRNLRGG